MTIQRCMFIFLLAAMAAMVVGCANTVPKPEFSRGATPASRITSSDQVQVKVDAANSIDMFQGDKDRLAFKIKTKIDSKKGTKADQKPTTSYAVELNLSQYDKGNAFARLVLAGLGQIHIEGKVTVYQLPDRVIAQEFELKKTFAWGGGYGAATSIEDIEDTFSDGVAAAVTGQNP